MLLAIYLHGFIQAISGVFIAILMHKIAANFALRFEWRIIMKPEKLIKLTSYPSMYGESILYVSKPFVQPEKQTHSVVKIWNSIMEALVRWGERTSEECKIRNYWL